MPRKLAHRDIVLITLPSNQPRGREQEGRRPAVVVGVPMEAVRYPVLILVPLTTQIGEWAVRNSTLYPQLEAGRGGLTQNSIVLIDQVRAVDVQRVLSYLGSLTIEEYKPILEGLRLMLGI